MEQLKRIPPARALLVAYAVYSIFIHISIAHSLILVALAAFAGYEMYIRSHREPKIEDKIEALKLELLKALEVQKHDYEAKIKLVENEQQRTALAKVNAPEAKKRAPIQF